MKKFNVLVVAIVLCTIASSIRSEDAPQSKSWRDRIYDTAANVGGGLYNINRQFGLGGLPEKDYSLLDELQTIYRNRGRGVLGVNPSQFGEIDERAYLKAVVHEEQERRGQHKGRYEGARNAALAAAAAYAGYRAFDWAYNRWFRNEEKHIENLFDRVKKTVMEIKKSADKVIKKLNKEDNKEQKDDAAMERAKSIAGILEKVVSLYKDKDFTNEDAANALKINFKKKIESVNLNGSKIDSEKN